MATSGSGSMDACKPNISNNMKNPKLAVPNALIRSAFYKTSDGLGRLIAAIEGTEVTAGDPALSRALQGLQKAFDEVYRVLEEKYNWD